VIIDIVLKPNSGVNPVQSSGHWSGWPLRPNKKKIKNNQSNLVLTIIFSQKIESFLSVFYPWLTWNFDWIRPSQSFIFFQS
jgi:hypothetical protein